MATTGKVSFTPGDDVMATTTKDLAQRLTGSPLLDAIVDLIERREGRDIDIRMESPEMVDPAGPYTILCRPQPKTKVTITFEIDLDKLA